MSALIGYGGAVVLVAIAVIATVVLRRRRRPSRNVASPSTFAKGEDTAATGYVPGIWMLGGAESAAPGHHAPHHGLDAGGSHAADAGGSTGDSGGSDGGGGGGH